MANRRLTQSVTTLIIRGGWKSRRYPGSTRFQANCRALAGAFGGKARRERHLPVVALFAAVERESEILDKLCPNGDKIVAILLRIGAYSDRWVRSLERWRPETTSAATQLGELVRHLFERYPTPTFFESAWRRVRRSVVDWAAFDWYVHVAGGESIRTAPGLPVALSPRAAHEFATAPHDVTPRDALRWAQIRALGVRPYLVRALLPSIGMTDLQTDPFWRPVLTKLAAESDVHAIEVGPLIDYLRNLYRESDGSFSLKGRSVAALRAGMERWHRDLATERYARAYAHLVPGGTAARWDALDDALGLREERGDERWEIAELLSFGELFEEGRRMHHCVANYVASCVARSTSIWSLRIRRDGCEAKRVTIRVETPKRAVVEARAAANAAITRTEHHFIEHWARLNRLSVEAIPVSS